MNVVVDAVESIKKLDVPFFAVPRVGAPPVTGCAPRSARSFDAAVDAAEGDPGWNGVLQLNRGFESWAEKTNGPR